MVFERAEPDAPDLPAGLHFLWVEAPSSSWVHGLHALHRTPDAPQTFVGWLTGDRAQAVRGAGDLQAGRPEDRALLCCTVEANTH